MASKALVAWDGNSEKRSELRECDENASAERARALKDKSQSISCTISVRDALRFYG